MILFGNFTQLATLFLLFLQYIWYYNLYDYHKMNFQKNATNYHNIITTNIHFLTFNFKRQLNFMNILNVTFDLATIWPTSDLMVECLTVLISYHPWLSFNLVPLFWCELELKRHSCRNIVGMEAIFKKPNQTVVGMTHAQLTRTEKLDIHEKNHVLMNHSKDHKISPVIHWQYWL